MRAPDNSDRHVVCAPVLVSTSSQMMDSLWWQLIVTHVKYSFKREGRKKKKRRFDTDLQANSSCNLYATIVAIDLKMKSNRCISCSYAFSFLIQNERFFLLHHSVDTSTYMLNPNTMRKIIVATKLNLTNWKQFKLFKFHHKWTLIESIFARFSIPQCIRPLINDNFNSFINK